MKSRFARLCSVSIVAVAVLAGSALAVTTPFGGYRETWDSYATGNADSTYQNVWANYLITPGTNGNANFVQTEEAEYPIIGSFGSVSFPNAIQYAVKNRALVNSLVDGKTNGTAAGAELSAGQVIIPDQSAILNMDNTLGNTDNLQLRTMINFNGNGTNRSRTGHYTELSFGEIHAPTLTGGLESLETAIPLIALGKLDAAVTNADQTINASNTSLYFFDGKAWFRLGSLAVSNGQNIMTAKLFYDGSSEFGWSAYIQFLNNTGQTSSNQIVPLQFDPTVLGFNTVSYILPNAVEVSPGGTLPTFDDVWVAGGLVIPEPTTLIFIGLGSMLLIRRRRR